MDQDAVKREFASRGTVYQQLEEEATFILRSEITRRAIKTHSVTSRVKTLDSFLDKVRRKECNDPFTEIHDVVGLRVICLFLSDVPKLGDLIRDCFLVVEEDNKVEDYDASSFGYLSVHFVARMKEHYKGPRYDAIGGVVFEVQVATLAMHAWAAISHYLDYKRDNDVPKELRKDFYALSGLFYVADTHFEMFFKARQSSQQQMAQLARVEGIDINQEINLDSLRTYLETKYPDRRTASPAELSELISEISKVGLKTIGDLEKLAHVATDALLAYERESPPFDRDSNLKTRYAQIGVVRIMLCLVNQRYREQKNHAMRPKYIAMVKEQLDFG
jgi:GTP pyrophosphokinase